jgi:hypothetical protein
VIVEVAVGSSLAVGVFVGLGEVVIGVGDAQPVRRVKSRISGMNLFKLFIDGKPFPTPRLVTFQT